MHLISITDSFFRNSEKVAKAGNETEMLRVGACYSTGYGVPKDENMAVEWCVNAAKAKSLDSLFYLAENCEIGKIPVPAEMAFTWYHDAAKAGHLGAMWKVICCYSCGYGTEKNA